MSDKDLAPTCSQCDEQRPHLHGDFTRSDGTRTSIYFVNEEDRDA